MSNKVEEKEKQEEQEKKFQEKLKKFHVDNKYDPYVLKNSLDECIKDILLEKYNSKESHKYEDMKIILGLIIALVVAISHYYPLPFPQNYYIIIACIISYAILSAIYAYYENYVEKDCFILFKYISKNEESPFLRFCSKIKLCSEIYELSLQDFKRLEISSKALNYSDYFDVKGNISYAKVEKIIEECLSDYKKKPL